MIQSMTLPEAIQQTQEHIKGLLAAVRVAANNGGKPIYNAEGKPLKFAAPSLGDLMLAVMQAQSLTLAITELQMNTLAAGFILAEKEAIRIADLVIKKLDSVQAEPGPVTQENVPQASP